MRKNGFVMIDALLAGVLVIVATVIAMQARSSGDAIKAADSTLVNQLAVEKAYSSLLYQYAADLTVAGQFLVGSGNNNASLNAQTVQWSKGMLDFCTDLVNESQSVATTSQNNANRISTNPSPFEVWYQTYSKLGYVYLNKCTKVTNGNQDARNAVELEIEMCWRDMTGTAGTTGAVSSTCSKRNGTDSAGPVGYAAKKFYVYLTKG